MRFPGQNACEISSEFGQEHPSPFHSKRTPRTQTILALLLIFCPSSMPEAFWLPTGGAEAGPEGAPISVEPPC